MNYISAKYKNRLIGQIFDYKVATRNLEKMLPGENVSECAALYKFQKL